MKGYTGHKSQLSEVAQLFLVVSPDAADDTVGAGGNLQQIHILYDRHHAVLAWDGLSMRTALGTPGNLIDPVLNLIVHAERKLVGELVSLIPTVFHHFD